jgi:diguanylate cyclase (GGDEF)-like protein
VLNFTNKLDGKRFTREDLRLATRLAEQAAQAINNARLYHLAVREPASGLYNRVHLYHRLGDEICRARRYQRAFVLMAVGMDGLQQLRRRYGHGTINQLERALAEVLSATTRETDLIGRLGEATLGVLLPETDANAARFLAERVLQEAARHPLIIEHGVLPLVGICSYPDRASTPQQLASRAELAMELAAHAPERIQVYLASVEPALQPAAQVG